MSAKDFGAAIAAYTQAIQLNPNSAVYFSNRSAAYSQLGQHDKSIEDAKEASRVDPKFAKAYSRLGHALFSTSKFQEAAEAYTKGLELDPNNQSMRSGLEIARKHAQDAQDAQDAPGSPSARSAPAGAGGGAGGGLDFALTGTFMRCLQVVAKSSNHADGPADDAEWRPGGFDEQPDAQEHDGRWRWRYARHQRTHAESANGRNGTKLDGRWSWTWSRRQRQP
ncbi:TPR repeat-containing protein [Ceraceosorus bombacis]|uniref:TPR repeat-containing protein n=1 Tax=Ceraceosorus bombacis TaxID=401625 RepID=A0A0P1B9D5_9BASI|nr:TPR repeat-containing protein [Ceraceosorus bombacis]